MNVRNIQVDDIVCAKYMQGSDFELDVKYGIVTGLAVGGCYVNAVNNGNRYIHVKWDEIYTPVIRPRIGDEVRFCIADGISEICTIENIYSLNEKYPIKLSSNGTIKFEEILVLWPKEWPSKL